MSLNDPESSQKSFRYIGENLYRRESSNVYYALLKRGGKQFRRSLKTTDKELAKRRLEELRREIGGLSTQDGAAVTFETVADLWQASIRHTTKESTTLRRKQCITAILPFFDGIPIRNVTSAHCTKWATERGDKISSSTFSQELISMRGVFDYAKDQGLILKNPALNLKRKRIITRRIEVPSRDQFRALVEALPQNCADLVELLAYSGCRLDEARNLRWENVSFERNCVTVTGGERMTKNCEVRDVPMSTALSGLLLRLQAESKPNQKDFIVKIKSAKATVPRTCERLGFPRFTHHTFRHFFATTCIESGVDIPTVSRWLGHRDGGALAMKVYGHLRQEHSFLQIKRVSFAPAEKIVAAPPENQTFKASGDSQTKILPTSIL